MQTVRKDLSGVLRAGDDIRVLESGAQIVSGTPGRVFDMIKRRSLTTGDMKILVLDEADEMLNKGFREQIYDVYRFLPPDIQVIIVSATLPHDVLEMTHKFMQDPVRVLVKRDELTLEVGLLLPSMLHQTLYPLDSVSELLSKCVQAV